MTTWEDCSRMEREKQKMAAQRTIVRLRGRAAYDPWARAALQALTRYRRAGGAGERAEAARALREAAEAGDAPVADILAWGTI